jgi:hypothetical protein
MYALDATEARKADNTGNSIREMGKYTGKFTQAEDITASTGTKGVALTFEANGQKTRFSLYTKRANGETIMGFQALMAIMACLKLRNITPQQGQITFWDNDAHAEKTKTGTVFPELCGKPIGILLETEDYLNRNNELRTRMVFAGAFQAGTNLTASEILDQKTKPEQLEKMVAYLRHRPIKAAKGAAQAPAARPSAGGGPGFEDMDDDIPFSDPLKSRAFCLAI